MSFESEIEGPMVELAHRLLDARRFASVEGFSAFLDAVKSGRWNTLPDRDRLHWIRMLSTSLGAQHGLASFPEWKDSDLLERVRGLVAAYERSLDKAA